MYRVSHPCPYSVEVKLPPSIWWKPARLLKSTADGLKIHEIAMKVSGIIDRSASVVANPVPNRSPRYAGMNSSRIPTTEIPSVHHAIGVWIGVKPAVERWKRSTM